MSANKDALIAALKRCAVLMELSGENPFRCRAYEQGARVLESLEGQPADWIASGELENTKGIGKGLAEKMKEWAETGRIQMLEELTEKVPPGLIEILTIPGLGPKKIKLLWEKRGVDSLDKLETAARDGSLADLPNFGLKTAEKILAGIQQRRRYSTRHNIEAAGNAAKIILDRLRELLQTERIELAGSLRRNRETVKDLDIVATSANPKTVMDVFVETPGMESVIAHGETKSSILLQGGLSADLRVVERDQFAAALNYFTGSKEHNTALRGRAKRMGFKLNEYGLFPDDGDPATAPIPTLDEADIYSHLGLAYIPPELREDMGELDAAEQGQLPDLITQARVRGMLHCHTTYSDGRITLRELAAASRQAGYKYLVVCDHSQSAAYAGGLKPDQVEQQWKEIDRLNNELRGFRIFKGIESDILPDGNLDYDDDLLKGFDLIVASIHSSMTMNQEEMTERICRALGHPATTILGHPTGRLLLQREPYALELERVLQTAARHQVVIEINANPWRLDLDWRWIRRAKAMGCTFAICPDAHDLAGLVHVAYGIGVARKGWLEPADVTNTKSFTDFSTWLRKRRKVKWSGSA